ncbi:sporulation regulation protein [Flavobacterium saliperosum S13]|uniref:Negative transcriptional regulator, PaiB family n=2 Tax=Flavobacterium saliperosum TaxID=329186 RepID=A0A1G4VQS2_9FLAO|nr:FMN-binding negative transcriptional regulator [Flavobacterium saliperosum]ESU23836.1 sporulation regulation protein [Flavobacterium saliperosum S13]SCX10399.1 negative transcriptional regulator, PaiB family [Flavobacterium saliperosum]
MYIPELYKNENAEEIKSFLKSNSFGILINQTEGKLWGTHIPLELETNARGKEVLFGHVSKENPQWQAFENNKEVLAIFSGPHSYISSSWYDHENVPTWNYIAVHVYGKISIIEGDEMLFALKKLVDKYEATSKNPVKIENLSEETMRQTNGFVAFEIEINEIQAVKKLSQNRDDKNHIRIISELRKCPHQNAQDIAGEMVKQRK